MMKLVRNENLKGTIMWHIVNEKVLHSNQFCQVEPVLVCRKVVTGK